MDNVIDSVTIRDRGQVTIPKAVVEQFTGVDRWDLLIKDGCIVLRPKIEQDVSWYYTPEWQEAMARSDQAIAEGRYVEYETAADAAKAARARLEDLRRRKGE